jgi:antitoxin CptB
VQRAPGIPHALKGGEKIHARLGRFAPRDLYACLEIVIASGAKQSILSLRGKMDCFAPLAMTAPARICATRWFGMAALWPKKLFWPATSWVANLHCEQLLTFAATIAISTPPGITSGLLALDGNRKMTGSTRSSGGLDDRRKRLLFRCWHRGTREMDLILGRFADAEIANLTEGELAQLEHLIEVPDPDLYAALTGDTPLAPEYASSLFDRIKSFRAVDHDA